MASQRTDVSGWLVASLIAAFAAGRSISRKSDSHSFPIRSSDWTMEEGLLVDAEATNPASFSVNCKLASCCNRTSELRADAVLTAGKAPILPTLPISS